MKTLYSQIFEENPNIPLFLLAIQLDYCHFPNIFDARLANDGKEIVISCSELREVACAPHEVVVENNYFLELYQCAVRKNVTCYVFSVPSAIEDLCLNIWKKSPHISASEQLEEAYKEICNTDMEQMEKMEAAAREAAMGIEDGSAIISDINIGAAPANMEGRVYQEPTEERSVLDPTAPLRDLKQDLAVQDITGIVQ